MNYLNKSLEPLLPEYENIELALYGFLGFFIPLFFSHPQIITGALVNAFLILSALHFKGYKSLYLVFIPSIAALLRGVLFGPFTVFLVYMLPFIWIGNAILVLVFKKMFVVERRNYWLTLAIGGLLKAGFLFIMAYILFSFSLVPKLFLTAFGIMQFITACLGGAVAYLRFLIKRN